MLISNFVWMFTRHVERSMPSSGMWRRVDLVQTDISEERIASIFSVEKSASGTQSAATC
jgi:hypothetical protein